MSRTSTAMQGKKKVKKDLACFQIQEIVFLISILLQRLLHHLVQQNGMKLSLWGLLNFASKIE